MRLECRSRAYLRKTCAWLEARAMSTATHPFHVKSSSQFVPPERWCVTLEDLGRFEEDVRARYDDKRKELERAHEQVDRCSA